MYLDFYNLKKEPFQLTPDPEFLFLSPSHKEALAAIMYGVEKRKGFITITGEVGVGKTTVLRSYLEQVEKEGLRTIYIFNPNLSFKGLLKTIFQELSLDAKSAEPSEMVTELYRILIDEYKQGRNVVLIIDEAQNMPIETLENLRMLSNLETDRDKLIQTVLVGQPEFDEMLNRKELRQLKQRIAVKTTISSLHKDECMAYIQHRLTKASLHGSTVFTQHALRKIIAHAHGVPRLLNVYCDNALITGFGYQKDRITAGIAKEVIADFQKKRTSLSLKWGFAVIALLLMGGTLSVFLYGENVLSGIEGIPKFTKQEKQISHINENTGSLQSAQSAGAALTPSSAKPDEEARPAIPGPIQQPALLEAKKAPDTVIRSIRKGDNLLKLIREIYGYSDQKLIGLVMQHNPGIVTGDKIRAGDEIIFPARGEVK